MKKNTIISSISAAIFLLPVALISLTKSKEKRDLKRRVLADANSDYNEIAKNIALSISKSKKLYKDLIFLVHPDRFQDDRKEKATELSARITKAKRNYEDLVGLEIEVKDFLGQ